MICKECEYHQNDEVTTTYTDPEGVVGVITEVSCVGYCYLEPVLVPRGEKSPACQHYSLEVL